MWEIKIIIPPIFFFFVSGVKTLAGGEYAKDVEIGVAI